MGLKIITVIYNTSNFDKTSVKRTANIIISVVLPDLVAGSLVLRVPR